MKKIFWGKRFSSNEEVKEAVTTWFEEQSKDFFFQGDKVVATKVGEVVGNTHMVNLPELIKFPPTQSYLLTCTAQHMLDMEHQRGALSRTRQNSFVWPPIMGNHAGNVA